MSAKGLDRFFEQMLAEAGGVEDPRILAGRSELVAVLAHMPDEIYESESAVFFLDRVAAETSPAPPELVAAVTAEVMRETRKATVTDQRRRAVPGWGWTAGAVAALALAIFAARLSERRAEPVASVVPAPAIAALQAPVKSDIASPVSLPPPPAPKLPERSDALIDGKAFNPVVTPPPPPVAKPKRAPEPVYTAPNPPVALTSHAVTAEDYPPASVRLQEQGAVTLQYTIETDGTVSNCTVTMTSGFPRLDEAACILVKKWTFKPATVIGGAPVAVTIPAQIVYALAGAPSGPPPSLVQSNKSGVLLDGEAFNAIGVIGVPALGVPVPAPPTPPIALSSHVVTAEDYPADSIRLGEQGRVQIKYTIGPDGQVIECAVTMTSGKPRLDDAACAMAKTKWKFKPATQNGRPVAVSVPAEIIFALK